MCSRLNCKKCAVTYEVVDESGLTRSFGVDSLTYIMWAKGVVLEVDLVPADPKNPNGKSKTVIREGKYTSTSYLEEDITIRVIHPTGPCPKPSENSQLQALFKAWVIVCRDSMYVKTPESMFLRNFSKEYHNILSSDAKQSRPTVRVDIMERLLTFTDAIRNHPKIGQLSDALEGVFKYCLHEDRRGSGVLATEYRGMQVSNKNMVKKISFSGVRDVVEYYCQYPLPVSEYVIKKHLKKTARGGFPWPISVGNGVYVIFRKE